MPTTTIEQNVVPFPRRGRATPDASSPPDARLLPWIMLSPVEQRLLRNAFGELLADAIADQRDDAICWFFMRRWQTSRAGPVRLTVDEARRLAAELAWAGFRTEGADRRALLRRSRLWAARARR